jgi:inosine-uridine nucleoside N-ribohydrolase
MVHHLSIAVAMLVHSAVTPGGSTPYSGGGIIVDTDTALLVQGFDIDDDLALIYLTAAKVPLLGITNTFGNDVEKRTHQDSERLLELMPQQTAKAYSGADVLAQHEPTNASAFIGTTLRESAGNVTVLCIGAMSNLATALRGEPALAGKIGQLVLLGGNLDNTTLEMDVLSSANYYFDLESTAVLVNLTRAVPTVVLPVQVMVQAAVTQAVVDALGNCTTSIVGSPDVHSRISDWRVSHVMRMNTTFGTMPFFSPGGFFPWDVHAATVVTQPELYSNFGTYRMTVAHDDLRIVLKEVAKGTSNIVAPRKLDAAAFLATFVERLCAV